MSNKNSFLQRRSSLGDNDPNSPSDRLTSRRGSALGSAISIASSRRGSVTGNSGDGRRASVGTLPSADQLKNGENGSPGGSRLVDRRPSQWDKFKEGGASIGNFLFRRKQSRIDASEGLSEAEKNAITNTCGGESPAAAGPHGVRSRRSSDRNASSSKFDGSRRRSSVTSVTDFLTSRRGSVADGNGGRSHRGSDDYGVRVSADEIAQMLDRALDSKLLKLKEDLLRAMAQANVRSNLERIDSSIMMMTAKLDSVQHQQLVGDRWY